MTDQETRDQEIERYLEGAFEDNYEILRVEAARSLAPAARRAAYRQVLFYWRKLHEIAEKVTDTEIALSLPNQRTPDGRPYTITGVVDIVREKGRTTMYDIKSHPEHYVRDNRAFYEKQLNVYAHIWQTLRGEALDEAGVIATKHPKKVDRAFDQDDLEVLAHHLAQWDPVIPLPFSQARVEETIQEFGETVDDIEEGRFKPPPLSKLEEERGSRAETFATRTCRQCDARFSCESYREYLRKTYGSASRGVRKRQAPYVQYLADTDDDLEREEWLTATQEDAPSRDDLRANYIE